MCALMVAALGTGHCARAAGRATELPKGVVVTYATGPDAFKMGCYRDGMSAVVEADGPGFTRAIRTTNPKIGAPWNMEAQCPLKAAINKGDAMLMTFWARVITTTQESEQAVFSAYCQQAAAPWRKSLNREFTVGSEWREFLLPFRAVVDCPAGTATLGFMTGQAEQTVEFGGARLVSYGPDVKLVDLPQTVVTYEGRDPRAPWREAAGERIRRHRMAPYRVRVVDAAGQPVPGAEVRVRMTRHAYEFGMAFPAPLAVKDDKGSAALREKLPELFNAGSFVNALKWPPTAGDWGPRNDEVLQPGLEWAKRNGIRMRGHVLVWPGRAHVARSVLPLIEQRDAPGIRRAVLEHIDDITVRTRGHLVEWDVLNEPYSNRDLTDICGRRVMVEWFERACRNLPGVALALNDYGILASLTKSPHQTHFEETIAFLLKEGAPLDVIGMQGHFGGTVPSPAEMLATLERFARFGLPIRVTEFTVGGSDPQLQADFLRDCLTLVFSHSATVGFQVWDTKQFFDRETGAERPMAGIWRQLVLKTWWTDKTGRTGVDGLLAGRGYLGSYQLTVTHDGTTASVPVALARDSKPFTIVLP